MTQKDQDSHMTLKKEKRLDQQPNVNLYFTLFCKRQDHEEQEKNQGGVRWRDRRDKKKKKINNLV